MDVRKLRKLIERVVAKEVKKQLPIWLEQMGTAHSNKRLTEVDEVEVDPFKLANAVLEQDRGVVNSTSPPNVKMKRLSSNPMLNEILNETTPFNMTPMDSAIPVDSDDKTVNFDTNIAESGIDGLKAQMAQKMGYGDVAPINTPENSGMGVTTGLSGLDRILNRDNSELVKRFKTR